MVKMNSVACQSSGGVFEQQTMFLQDLKERQSTMKHIAQRINAGPEGGVSSFVAECKVLVNLLSGDKAEVQKQLSQE